MHLLPAASLTMLDLFCVAGLAADGYAWAARELGVNLRIIGIDHHRQPNYPYEFVQADLSDGVPWRALFWLGITPADVDFIHASPPCQIHSTLAALQKNTNYHERHVNLIPSTRRAIQEWPYIIENVAGARDELHNPVMLCGWTLGLKTYRHRPFEFGGSLAIVEPVHLRHPEPCPSVGRGISPIYGIMSLTGNGGPGGNTPQKGRARGVPIPHGRSHLSYAKQAFGIPDARCITKRELTQAIPPAYTHYLGLQALAQIAGLQPRYSVPAQLKLAI